MKTKLFSIALIGMFAFILAGCSTDETVQNDLQEKIVQYTLTDYHFLGQPPTSIYRKNGVAVEKTIKFHEAEGPFEFKYGVDGCDPYPYLNINGTGIASHIGNYSVINYGCYDGFSLILGVITAANGDEIHTYINSAYQDLETGMWYYHYKVYNGTGRFAGAEGDIYMTGTLDFENFKWSLQGEGFITY